MEKWRLETFKSMIGESLVATELEGTNSCHLKVAEVNEYDSLGDGWESFSVIFHCDEAIGQGSLEIHHDSYPSTVVFLTPKTSNELEAIFNYEI